MQSSMKSKRGFMLGEYTLKVIIAVLCLLLLVYLLFRLYSNYENEKDLRMAESVLNDLSDTMIVAREKGLVQEFTVLGPNEWVLISYSKGENRPLSCKNSCICLCKHYEGIWWQYEPEKVVNWCNTRGMCKNFDDRIKKFGWGFYQGEEEGQWNKKNLWNNAIIGDLNVEYVGGEFVITKVVSK